jgi:hypothetical protein
LSIPREREERGQRERKKLTLDASNHFQIDKQGTGLNLIDLGAGTQSLLAQLEELNGVEIGGAAGGVGPLTLDEDLFVVAAGDASAALGGASSASRRGGRGGSPSARVLGSGVAARFGGFEDDGGGGEPPLGGGGRAGAQQQLLREETTGAGEGAAAAAAAAAAAGHTLAAGPDDFLDGLGGWGGGEAEPQHPMEEEEVVGGARLAPGSAARAAAAAAAPSVRRVARPAVDAEAAGLLPSSVIRSWIQDAGPTLVPGGRGSSGAGAAAAAASLAGLPPPPPSRRAARGGAARGGVDELRRRLAPRGPFFAASASASAVASSVPLGPWPTPLQVMLVSRMTVPGVADEPPPAGRGRGRKRGRGGGAAAPQSPAADADGAPLDAFAEANAGGENVHDFGFGEFGAAGEGKQMQIQQLGGFGGDGWGGGWRLSPADALLAADAGGEFGTNYGGHEDGGYGDGYDGGGIERMRAALLASAGRDGGAGAALGRSPGSAGLAAAGATPGGGRTSSGDRPSSDADGTRSGDENAGAGEATDRRRRGGGAGGGAPLGALDEEWETQFPAGGSLLEETGGEAGGEQGGPRRGRRAPLATRLPRVEELPAATRAAVEAMRARFSAMVSSGRPPRLSLDAATAGASATGGGGGGGGGGSGRQLSRLDAARLFYQVCACVSTGYVRAAQRAPYGDVLLAPGRAMGNLEGAGGGGGGGGGWRKVASAAAAAAASGRVVSARA